MINIRHDFNDKFTFYNKASASGAVDSGLIPNQFKPMNAKLVFTSFPSTISIKGHCGE